MSKTQRTDFCVMKGCPAPPTARAGTYLSVIISGPGLWARVMERSLVSPRNPPHLSDSNTTRQDASRRMEDRCVPATPRRLACDFLVLCAQKQVSTMRHGEMLQKAKERQAAMWTLFLFPVIKKPIIRYVEVQVLNFYQWGKKDFERHGWSLLWSKP